MRHVQIKVLECGLFKWYHMRICILTTCVLFIYIRSDLRESYLFNMVNIQHCTFLKTFSQDNDYISSNPLIHDIIHHMYSYFLMTKHTKCTNTNWRKLVAHDSTPKYVYCFFRLLKANIYILIVDCIK